MARNSMLENVSRSASALRKLQQGTHSSVGDVLDWTYYDTEVLAVASLQFRYFVSGVGKAFTAAAAGNKLLSDSNVLTDQVPTGQKFTVKQIRAFYRAHALSANATMQSILDTAFQTTVEFKISGKDVILQMLLADLLGLNLAAINVPTVAGDSIGTHMRNMIRSGYSLHVDIPLAMNTRYEVTMTHHTAVAATLATDRITFALQGVLERLS